LKEGISVESHHIVHALLWLVSFVG